jgi:hypothetical protein
LLVDLFAASDVAAGSRLGGELAEQLRVGCGRARRQEYCSSEFTSRRSATVGSSCPAGEGADCQCHVGRHEIFDQGGSLGGDAAHTQQRSMSMHVFLALSHSLQSHDSILVEICP